MERKGPNQVRRGVGGGSERNDRVGSAHDRGKDIPCVWMADLVKWFIDSVMVRPDCLSARLSTLYDWTFNRAQLAIRRERNAVRPNRQERAGTLAGARH